MRGRVAVLFTAHSVPSRTVLPSSKSVGLYLANGPDSYADDCKLTAKLVASELPDMVSERDCRFSFQSQGMSGGPWLGPRVEDTLAGLKRCGYDTVVIQPIGFLCDMLLGPRQDRPPVIGCGVNPLMLSSRESGLTLPCDNTQEGQRRILEENQKNESMFQPITDYMNLMMRICDAPSMPHSLFFDSMYLLPDLFPQFLAEEFEFPRSDTADTIHFAGPLMPRRSVEFDEPAWWSELDGSRPVVLVTQGTMARIRISMKRCRLQPRTVGRSIREGLSGPL